MNEWVMDMPWLRHSTAAAFTSLGTQPLPRMREKTGRARRKCTLRRKRSQALEPGNVAHLDCQNPTCTRTRLLLTDPGVLKKWLCGRSERHFPRAGAGSPQSKTKEPTHSTHKPATHAQHPPKARCTCIHVLICVGLCIFLPKYAPKWAPFWTSQ